MPNIQHAAPSAGLFCQPSSMVVFCHHKTGLDPVLEEKKQWNKWVLKGRRSWGPLHSVIMKWELSFWISYFNTIGKIM